MARETKVNYDLMQGTKDKMHYLLKYAGVEILSYKVKSRTNLQFQSSSWQGMECKQR